jgi:tetratricopeptide (TPR) repeat protein
VARLRRDHTQANTHYQEALALARRLGFPEDTAVILNQWAGCRLEEQQLAPAAEMYREALAIAGAANLQREIAKSLFGQAQIACRRGNVAEARRLGQESQRLYAAMGHKKASEVQWWLAELPRELEEG